MYYYNEDDDRRMAAEYAARGKYDEGYEQGKKDALRSQWIPVSERLPEDGVDVLIYLKNGWFVTGCWTKEAGAVTWRTKFWAIRLLDLPAYWMPLPEPPKEV